MGFLFKLAGNRTVAEDVSQRVWLTVIEMAAAGHYAAKAEGSFITLGRNRFIDDYWRKHEVARTEPLNEPDLIGDERSELDPSDRAGRAQRSAILREALDELPHEQREVIAMWSKGVSAATMATITGVPRDTVLSRKKYALGNLRDTLQRLGVDQSVI